MRKGLAAAIVIGLTAGGAAHAERLTAVEGRGWFTVAPAPGASAGLRLAHGSRSFTARGRAFDADVTALALRGGLTPLRGVHIWGELGAAQASVDGRSGEVGPAGGVGLALRPLVLVLRGTDLSPRKEQIALDIETSVRATVSNRRGERMDWWDMQAVPSIAYRLDRSDEPGRRVYEPVETGLRIGALWRRTEGRRGAASLRENRNFGVALGADLRWTGGWATHLDAALLGRGDLEFGLGLARHF